MELQYIIDLITELVSLEVNPKKHHARINELKQILHKEHHKTGTPRLYPEQSQWQVGDVYGSGKVQEPSIHDQLAQALKDYQ